MPPTRDNNTSKPRRRVRKKAVARKSLLDRTVEVGKDAFKDAKPSVRRKSAGKSGFAGAKASGRTSAAKGVNATATGKVRVVKKKGGAGTLGLITAPVSAVSPIGAAVDLATGSKGLKTVLKVAKNAPKDAAEIAVTTPSSLYHLGDTLLHDPEKVPGMLLEPYKQLAKDPAKFVTEKPVSSLLMAAGPVRGTTRAAGKGLRVAGKQTLKREPAVVPGTALRIERHRSKDAVVNAVQARRDRKAGAVVAKPRQIRRAIDSTYDATVKAESRARTRAAKEAKAKRMTPAEGEAHIKAAVKAARVESNRKIVRDFGATGRPGVPAAVRGDAKAGRRAAEAELAAASGVLAPVRVKRKLAEADARVASARSGRGVPPKQHDKLLAAIAEEDAAKVRVRQARATETAARAEHIAAKRQFREGGVVDDPGAKVGRTYVEKAEAQAVKKSLPFDSVIVKVDNEYGVVPKQVWERIESSPGKAVPHRKVGTSPAVGARVFRVSRGLFTRSVLPLSKNYVAGQAFESAGRSLVMGAGPTSYLRGRKILKAADRADAEGGQALRDRVFGEHYGEQGPIREFLGDNKKLAETFPESRAAAGLTRVGATPGVKQVRQGYRVWTEAVMKANAAIERQAQTAMLGKAVKEGPLMERRIIGLSDKAIEEAARGLTGTATQIKLGETVTRAYGKYTRFSPGMRETMMHSTPFLPWYINTATFLTKVLPVDHPVQASLVASLSAATEEWRKEQGLSLYSDSPNPDFLFGTGPDGTPIGRFLPFAPKDTTGAIGGLFLPQFSSATRNLFGTDWKGDKLPGGQENRAANAVLSLLSGMVPGVSQADRLTGVSKRHLNEGKDPSVLDGKSTDEVIADLKRMVNPLAKPKTKAKPKLSRGKSPQGSLPPLPALPPLPSLPPLED